MKHLKEGVEVTKVGELPFGFYCRNQTYQHQINDKVALSLVYAKEEDKNYCLAKLDLSDGDFKFELLAASL